MAKVKTVIKLPLFAAQQRPDAQEALVAGFPVGVVRFQGEACVNAEVQAGLVLKVDADAVVVGRGGKFHLFDSLAPGLRKMDDVSIAVRSRAAG